MTRGRVDSRTFDRMFLGVSITLVAFCVYPWGDVQDHAHWASVRWIPFVTPPIAPIDILANIGLFVPLGAAVSRILGPRVAVGLALALGLSFAGEAIQIFSHGRIPSTTDIVSNLVGLVAGSLFAQRRASTDIATSRALALLDAASEETDA